MRLLMHVIDPRGQEEALVAKVPEYDFLNKLNQLKSRPLPNKYQAPPRDYNALLDILKEQAEQANQTKELLIALFEAEKHRSVSILDAVGSTKKHSSINGLSFE